MATDLTRVLVTGWPSFPDGEATVGDVLAMEAVRDELTSAGVPCDLAWSPVLRPGALALADADPARYSHLVFACGPLRGSPVEDLHRRYARCRRVAIGVSVVDAADPAAAGFDAVLPRDAPGVSPAGDLAVRGPVRAGAEIPVAGVIMVAGQAEYAGRTRHEQVGETLDRWLRDGRCALIPLQTRLDPRDWRLCERPAQFEAIVRRLDLVITTRLHGLVLALSHGVPALAIDPVAGGAKVAAQARAWDWPAVVTTGRDTDLDRRDLSRWRDWCLSAAGRERAAAAAAAPPATPLGGLLAALRPVSAAGAG
jgi:hypothetical protein